MKQKPEETSLPNFLKEFAKNGLTPQKALGFIYGNWNEYGLGGFRLEDYSRYSTKARKEVVVAVRDNRNGGDWALENVCSGLVCIALDNPMPKDGKLEVLKELDLWKEWGVNEKLINTWVASSVASRMFPKCITEIDPLVLSAVMEYADVYISREDFDDLLNRIENATLDGRTQEVLRYIEARVR